jgi:hypothetical protein
MGGPGSCATRWAARLVKFTYGWNYVDGRPTRLIRITGTSAAGPQPQRGSPKRALAPPRRSRCGSPACLIAEKSTPSRASRATAISQAPRAARPGVGQHERMNAAQVEALRALLAPTGWLERTRYFARTLRRRATAHGLLIVGTPADEPWHMTAHLANEVRLAGLPELVPTLVRWAPPPGAPPHLRVGVDRLEQARRTDTLLVVSPGVAPTELVERVADAKKVGTAIFALDHGDPELVGLAHESLSVLPAQAPVSFDGAQHLVSFTMAESSRRPTFAAPALPGGYDDSGPDGRSRTAQPVPWRAPDSRALRIRAQLARLLNTISGPSGSIG